VHSKAWCFDAAFLASMAGSLPPLVPVAGGVAKAAYFPQITLTGSAGSQSSALTNLFNGPAGLWSFGGSLAQPVFAGGRIRSGVRFSEARQQETLLIYQQTIQQAFRGVSDALVEYRKDREFREQQQ
jgi:outer membrane protein, multidrug efflux system